MNDRFAPIPAVERLSALSTKQAWIGSGGCILSSASPDQISAHVVGVHCLTYRRQDAFEQCRARSECSPIMRVLMRRLGRKGISHFSTSAHRHRKQAEDRALAIDLAAEAAGPQRSPVLAFTITARTKAYSSRASAS